MNDSESTPIPKISIFASERIVDIKYVNFKKPNKLIDPIKVLSKLAQAKRVDQIGSNGPVHASMASLENKKLKDLNHFDALFGRDAIIVALNTYKYFPKLAKSTIIKLAELQGLQTSPKSEEEFGRILHEYRLPGDKYGQELIKENGWEFPYYGSVDSTPLFIILVCRYCLHYGLELLESEVTCRDGNKTSILTSLDRAIDWINARRSTNLEGLIESLRTNPKGLVNQAWKDNTESYSHADGSNANHKAGVASIEVQGYVYDAYLFSAIIYRLLSKRQVKQTKNSFHDAANILEDAALSVQKQIVSLMYFNKSSGSYFAIGTDRDTNNKIRSLNIITSNPGHLLDSQLFISPNGLDFEFEESIIKSLFSPFMLSAAGIRTLSVAEVQYRPGAYQNGSVWPWENHKISKGLANLGYFQLADLISNRTQNIFNSLKIYPEYVRGDSYTTPEVNRWDIVAENIKTGLRSRMEQPPQEIQAWTVSSAVEMKLIKQNKKHNNSSSLKRQSPKYRQRQALEKSIISSIELLHY